VLTRQRALACMALSEHVAHLDTWCILALFICQIRWCVKQEHKEVDSDGWESLHDQCGLRAGATEEWAGYISALPDRTDTVLDWGEDALQLVHHSTFAGDAASLCDSAQAAWADMDGVMQRLVVAGIVADGAVTAEAFRYCCYNT
jgi:hypothetical protein